MRFIQRFFRHAWMSPIIRDRLFSRRTLQAIEQAVAAGESMHRGQVRFVVEAELGFGQLWRGLSARQRALEVFSLLGVWDTDENNGVLIYVMLADRKVEIVADRGIHKHVGDERWQAICRELELHYRKGDFTAGSVSAVQKISEELRFYFPAHGAHKNEQPDAPVVM